MFELGNNLRGLCVDLRRWVFSRNLGNDKRKIILYQLSAGQGNADGMAQVGMYLSDLSDVRNPNGQDRINAIQLFRLTANQGHAVGQCGLGYCYYHGAPVNRDCDEAMRLFRLSAAQGNSKAIYMSDFLAKCGLAK